ncbi:MAG: response regulator transcription factor [Phycisphaerales bacterium]|nr:response regulator transcription factor [Phycisphaerales bacterium]
MSKSDRLRPRDIRAGYRLVGECRDLGADVVAWQEQLLAGFCKLLHAQVGISGNMRRFGAGDAESLGSVRIGWPDAQAERLWLEYATNVPVERTPEYPALIGGQDRLVTRTRDQLWGREAWYRSRTYNERHKRVGIDDYIISIQRLPFGDMQHSLWIHRAEGEPGFGRREWWLVRCVHEEVGRQIGNALASAAEPRLSDLTPRQRDALHGLLEGLAEKELAAQLGVGRATVHEHVLAIYRHYQVSSRAELMALFIGREPPRPGQVR